MGASGPPDTAAGPPHRRELQVVARKPANIAGAVVWAFREGPRKLRIQDGQAVERETSGSEERVRGLVGLEAPLMLTTRIRVLAGVNFDEPSREFVLGLSPLVLAWGVTAERWPIQVHAGTLIQRNDRVVDTGECEHNPPCVEGDHGKAALALSATADLGSLLERAIGRLPIF